MGQRIFREYGNVALSLKSEKSGDDLNVIDDTQISNKYPDSESNHWPNRGQAVFNKLNVSFIARRETVQCYIPSDMNIAQGKSGIFPSDGIADRMFDRFVHVNTQ